MCFSFASISRSMAVPSSYSMLSRRRRMNSSTSRTVTASPHLKKDTKAKLIAICPRPQCQVFAGVWSYNRIVTKLTNATSLMKLFSAGPVRSSNGPPICSPMPSVSYASLSAPMTASSLSRSIPKRMYLRAASHAWPELMRNMFKEKQTELPPLTSISKPLKPNNWPMTKGQPKVWINGLMVSLKHSMEANCTKSPKGLMCDTGNALSTRGATDGLSLQWATTAFAMAMHEVSVFARKSIVNMIEARRPARVKSDTSWPTVAL
mmetsp:Transcript_16215/g.48183  ORF Transcript_16215/g.48183 Transcript_16215/m.48183 type:complete len:263 (-) Transcript_16215:2232-3020(-)